MKQAIKRRLTGLVLSAIVLAALALPAFAADIPAAPSGHAVLDQAGVLSEETINTVDGYNNALSSTGAQIGVLTVDFTGNLSIDDYALQVFNEWGIGDKKKENGVLHCLINYNFVTQDAAADEHAMSDVKIEQGLENTDGSSENQKRNRQ